jgi:hypothetical protein
MMMRIMAWLRPRPVMAPGGGRRQADREAGAGAGAAVDLQAAAERRDALRDAEQAEVGRVVHRLRIEAPAVVLDQQVQLGDPGCPA